MSNQPKHTHETDPPDEPVDPPDAEPGYGEGGPDEERGSTTSDLPQGAKDGELPPAP
jgi:hypothetical protein